MKNVTDSETARETSPRNLRNKGQMTASHYKVIAVTADDLIKNRI
jgi:hypothetical protein